jgi:TPR repeat protein
MMPVTLDVSSEIKSVNFVENNKNNKIKLLTEYESLANQGYLEAQFQLGEMYQNGYNVHHDYALSIHWYKKAAEQGHAEAQYNLGVIYRKGRGVPIDFVEAFRWYKQAAEQGMPQAQNNLACLYFYGRGVAVNFEEGLFWYKKSAEQDTAKSQYNLGLIYQKGLGVEPNPDEELRWYKKAASKGYGEAIQKINILSGDDSQELLGGLTNEFTVDNSIEYADATESWLKEIVEQVSKASDLQEEEAIIHAAEAIEDATASEEAKDSEEINEILHYHTKCNT